MKRLSALNAVYVIAFITFLFALSPRARAQAYCGLYEVGEYNIVFSWEGSAEWSANQASDPTYEIYVSVPTNCPPPTAVVNQPSGLTTPLISISGPTRIAGTSEPDGYAIALNVGVNPSTNEAIGTIVVSAPGTLGIIADPFTITVGDFGRPPCTYAITPATSSYGAQGGSGHVTVTATPNSVSTPLSSCTWTAYSSVPWVTVTSAASEAGTQTIAYTVAAETANPATYQTGSIVLAGQTFGISQGPPCTATAALYDPVPALLNGASVSTSPAVLFSGGTPVQGVAADGAAELLVRIPVTDPNINCPTLTATLSEGTDSTDEGSVRMLNGGAVDPSTKMAFALYTAPLDYVTLNNTGDASTAHRTVRLAINANGQQIASETITVIRPLVVMIHGLWDDPSSWFTLDSPPVPPATTERFSQVRASYNGSVSLLSASPCVTAALDEPCYTPATVSGNALGLLYAAQTVEPQINQYLAAFRVGANAAGIPVAAVRADFIGHSMGGLVARQLAAMPSYQAGANFNQGFIHKLITIGTPHLGSPLPLQIVMDSNSCVRRLFHAFGMDAFSQVALASGSYSGAMNDLGSPGNGSSLSAALTALQATPQFLPTGFLAGQMSSLELSAVNNGNLVQDGLSVCAGNPLTTYLTSSNWPILMGGDSDAIVPLTSQLDGMAPTLPPVPAVHSQGAITLGFGGPYELQDGTSGSGISAQVITLLNTPVSSSIFTLIP